MRLNNAMPGFGTGLNALVRGFASETWSAGQPALRTARALATPLTNAPGFSTMTSTRSIGPAARQSLASRTQKVSMSTI